MWKTILEEVFDDLLRFLYTDADMAYDMDRGFEFLDNELAEIYPEPNKQSDTRFADKLVKVHTKGGKEEWMLLHIEIQGNTSRKQEFAERMFRYFYRILDRYRKPVSAVAIFTSGDWQKMPYRYEYACRNTNLVYQYQTLSIHSYTYEQLQNSNNPFVIVLMAARAAVLEGKVPDTFLMQKKLLIAKELLQKNIPIKKVRAIFAFLNNYVRFEDPKLNRIFTQQVDELDHKNYNMGIIEYLQQEAREEGREEGLKTGLQAANERLTRSLLEEREFSVTKIAKLVGVSTYFVNKIKKQLRLN